MKKIFLTIFSIIILFGFASKVQASYEIPTNYSAGWIYYAGEIGRYCNTVLDPNICTNFYQNLDLARDSMTNLGTLPQIRPGFQTFTSPDGGYMIWMPFDAEYDNVGSTLLMDWGTCPRGDININNGQCSIEGGIPVLSGPFCGDSTETFYTCARQPEGIRQIISGDDGYTQAWADYVLSATPLAICQFGLPLGNRTCPDLPNITAPASVVSGTPATISWSTEQTFITGTPADSTQPGTTPFITSCSVTSPVQNWSGLSANGGSVTSPALTSDTTFTLTCTNVFNKTYPASGTKSVTVNVTAASPSVTLTADDLTLPNGGSTILRWTYANVDSCEAYSPPTPTLPNGSGEQSTGNLAGPNTYTYNVSCTGGGTTVTDRVDIIVGP